MSWWVELGLDFHLDIKHFLLKEVFKVVLLSFFKCLNTASEVRVLNELANFSFETYDIHFARHTGALCFLLVRHIHASFLYIRLERRVAIIISAASLQDRWQIMNADFSFFLLIVTNPNVEVSFLNKINIVFRRVDMRRPSQSHRRIIFECFL